VLLDLAGALEDGGEPSIPPVSLDLPLGRVPIATVELDGRTRKTQKDSFESVVFGTFVL